MKYKYKKLWFFRLFLSIFLFRCKVHVVVNRLLAAVSYSTFKYEQDFSSNL